MRNPERVWVAPYANDRRKHSHRCVACSRIIKAGEPVIMGRPRNETRTKAVHVACADRPALPPSAIEQGTFEQWLRAICEQVER